MQFQDILEQTQQLLKRNGRMSTRALCRQFQIDKDFAADITAELVEILKVAVEDEDHTLIWTGQRDEPRHSLECSLQTPKPAQTKDRAAPGWPWDTVAPDKLEKSSGGERRYLTVMFSDIVESTQLAERVDSEDLADIYRIWHEAYAEAVELFQGYIADYRGDGTLVFYGYPHAFEDGPHRAIRTALGIMERLVKVNQQLQETYGETLRVRIGIHSGFVLLSDLGGKFSRDQFALGETLNIAARLQALAEPDSIVISNVTSQLVRGHFSLEDLGPVQLKGVSRPISGSRASAEISQNQRAISASEKTERAFVAREVELTILREKFAIASGGTGQTTFLTGEAGIGKSRLLKILQSFPEIAAARQIVLRCSPYHSTSALYPVISVVRAEIEAEPQQSDEARLEKLIHVLTAAGTFNPKRDARLIGALLGLNLGEGETTLPPKRRALRIEALNAIVAWTIGLAALQPLLIVVEDLHWADPSTLELFRLIQAAATQCRICTVMTARPEFDIGANFEANLSVITLAPLNQYQSEGVIEHLFGHKLLPAELKRHLVARAGGVPLFLEELVSMFLESDLLIEKDGVYKSIQPIATLQIPFTLQDLLATRLDSLDEARDTAQLAATFGRQFTFKQILAVSVLEEATLIERLDKIVARDLVYCEGQWPEVVYTFRHALIQEAAYQSMLKRRRQQNHRIIAKMLEAPPDDQPKAEPEILAHHFTEAGLFEPALNYWHEASELALQRSAIVEALLHCDRGIALTQSAAKIASALQIELRLQLTRGATLIMLKGQSAPEVLACYERARELAEGLSDSRELFLVLFGLWRSTISVGSTATAFQIGEQLVAMAQRMGDVILQLCSTSTLALTHYHLGQFCEALALSNAGIDLYNAMPKPVKDPLIFNMGQHPTLACYNCKAFILQLTGFPDLAADSQKMGQVFALDLGQPFQQAAAAGWGFMFDLLRGDTNAAQIQMQSLEILAVQHKYPLWKMLLDFHNFILKVKFDPSTYQRGELNRLIDGVLQESGSLFKKRAYALGAKACLTANDWEECDRLLHEGFATSRQNGEQWWEPELCNLAGELALYKDKSNLEGAAACFRMELRLATEMGLQHFRLQFATRLAKLAESQQNPQNGVVFLRKTYDEFSEGFETRDMVEARAILDQHKLNGAPIGTSQKSKAHR